MVPGLLLNFHGKMVALCNLTLDRRSRSRLTAPSMLGDVDPVMRVIEMEEIIGTSSETSDPATNQPNAKSNTNTTTNIIGI